MAWWGSGFLPPLENCGGSGLGVCALIIWSLRVACRGAKLKEVVRLSEAESNAISLLLWLLWGSYGLAGLVCRPLVIRDWVAGVCTWRFDQPTAGEPLRSDFFFVHTHTLSITHSILYSLVCTALAKKAAPTVKYLPNTAARHFFSLLFVSSSHTHSLTHSHQKKSQLVLYTYYSFCRSHYLAYARAANLTTRSAGLLHALRSPNLEVNRPERMSAKFSCCNLETCQANPWWFIAPTLQLRIAKFSSVTSKKCWNCRCLRSTNGKQTVAGRQSPVGVEIIAKKRGMKPSLWCKFVKCNKILEFYFKF